MSPLAIQTTYNANPDIAFAGMLVSAWPNETQTVRNAEAATSMPFGVAVCFKLAAPATDLDVLLPHANTDVVSGIVVHEHDFERTWTLPDGTVAGELDAVGLVPKTVFSMLRRGRIWVKMPATLAVAVGDRLFVRAVANGAISNQLGSCENAADGANTIDDTKIGQFVSSCSAGGFAQLEVDFTNKP